MAFNATFHSAQLTDAQGRLVSMSLHSGTDPTTANEITAAADRPSVDWGAISSGSMSATEDAPVGAGETVESVGFWDGSATPVFQGGGPVDVAETFSNAGTATVSVTVSES